MNIYELEWQPARIGFGFFATHEFDNGRTAHIRCEGISESGEDFRLTVFSRDGRLAYSKEHLDRAALLARLNYQAMLA